MVYPSNFGRIVASGTLYGSETFSFGLSIVPDFPGGTPLNPAGNIAAVAAAVSEFFTSVGIDNSAILTLLKFNEIGPDGRYVDQAETIQFEYDPPVAGIASGNPAPQVALAVSLMTARVRGRAHTGRFYLPVPTAPLEGDGLLSAANALEYADAATALCDDLNAIWAGSWVVGVASDVGPGRFEAATYIRVGRVYDTIRSRRRSLAENYVNAAPIA